MTSVLFLEWQERLAHFTKSRSSIRLLLLLDNCSAHGCEESLPSFYNVDYPFLQPNTTSQLQPLDAGIIANVNSSHRKWRAVYMMDLDDENIYKVDQLPGMRALSNIWRVITPSIFQNCWDHTTILGDS